MLAAYPKYLRKLIDADLEPLETCTREVQRWESELKKLQHNRVRILQGFAVRKFTRLRDEAKKQEEEVAGRIQEFQQELRAAQRAHEWSPQDVELRLRNLRRQKERFAPFQRILDGKGEGGAEDPGAAALGRLIFGPAAFATFGFNEERFHLLEDSIWELEQLLVSPPRAESSSRAKFLDDLEAEITGRADSLAEVERLRAALHEKHKEAPQQVHEAIDRICDDEAARILERRRRA